MPELSNVERSPAQLSPAELSSAEPRIARLLGEMLEATRLELTYQVRRHPGAVPALTVDLTGPDTGMPVARNGELLRAIEHLAAKVLRLGPAQHDMLSVNADRFKEKREAALAKLAEQATARVVDTGEPFRFPPMSSHERRRLHLILTGEGLRSASTGEGALRAVVLYPPAGRTA